MSFGANLKSLSKAAGVNFLANKKQTFVVFPLYSHLLPLLNLFKASTVTSVLKNLAGCGPPFDQSTQVKLLFEFLSQNLMLTNVGK
jgi:hypothetical protein